MDEYNGTSIIVGVGGYLTQLGFNKVLRNPYFGSNWIFYQSPIRGVAGPAANIAVELNSLGISYQVINEVPQGALSYADAAQRGIYNRGVINNINGQAAERAAASEVAASEAYLQNEIFLRGQSNWLQRSTQVDAVAVNRSWWNGTSRDIIPPNSASHLRPTGNEGGGRGFSPAPRMETDLNIEHPSRDTLNSARSWAQILSRYREPNHARSIGELAVTALPLAALWLASWFAYSLGYPWASLLIAIPAAGFLLRLFMIQHDCGHGTFFSYRWANDWTGRVIGVLTLTPYDFWRRTHAIHHASVGNLDRRGIGDVNTLTVREYRSRSWPGRLVYRLYRHPLVMFGLAPAYLFFLQQRLPVGLMRSGWGPWVSTSATNLAIGLIAAALVWSIGIKAFLFVHLPIVLLAATIGVWLFYVQHQFEDTAWEVDAEWNLHEAALRGSSYYDLPAILRWFTANIGVHHVHHLCSRIPYYRLPQVLRDHSELRQVGRLTLLESFRCINLVLWDETKRHLISFHDLNARVKD